MSSCAKFAKIQPGELVDALKEYPFLAQVNLAAFCSEDGILAHGGISYVPCTEPSQLCGSMCLLSHEKGVKQCLDKKRPIIYRCNGGMLHFAIPIKDSPPVTHAIIGGGVWEKVNDSTIDLPSRKSQEPLPLLQYMEKEPSMSSRELESLSIRIDKLLQSLQKKNIYAQVLEKTLQRITTISEISAEIEKITCVKDVATLLGETLGILFDISRVALVLPRQNEYVIHGILGLPSDLGCKNAQELADLLTPDPKRDTKRLKTDQARRLSDDVFSATSLPLRSGDEIIGFLVIFDHDLNPREALPIELLVGKVAVQLKHIYSLEDFEQRTAKAQKFMSMTGLLSLAKSREELYQLIIDMASDLLHARNGSLMLVDETNENLNIEAVKGMSVQVAKSMSIKIGRGIAGKVAQNGVPMLVSNIESDSRTRITNRPRFHTKSFISLPLRLNERIFGVLNLSDKKQDEVFVQSDLELLTTFTNQAMLIVERMDSAEKANQLEELSVTDPLTGLYNRRLLETRIVEEIHRSYRLKQGMTIMLIDLDNFKIYNDICGHIAGDNVLKKIALILKETARNMDIVTRYGGEEFCILLPSTSKRESMFVAERIRRAIENENFQDAEHLPLRRLTASIGIASYPEDGANDIALLKAADIALYQAKEEGRNRTIIFTQKADLDQTTKNTVHILQSP